MRELGGKPALERLAEVANALTDDERQLLARGLHVGLVVDEHQAEFGRGDFLVRNVRRREPGGRLDHGRRAGRRRPHRSSSRSATRSPRTRISRVLLAGAEAQRGAALHLHRARASGCSATRDHDAGLVEELLGPLPVAGAFCAGELGPVGGHNYVHGFTASLALFEA